MRGDSGSYYSQNTDTAADTLTPVDEWHHISYSWSQPSTCLFYLDGAAQGTSVGASSGTVSNTYSGAAVNDKSYFTLDLTNYNADLTIAYEHIHNRVLSADEVSEIMYHPGSIVNGLVSYTPFLNDTPVDQVTGVTSTAAGNVVSDPDGPPVFFPQ